MSALHYSSEVAITIGDQLGKSFEAQGDYVEVVYVFLDQ